MKDLEDQLRESFEAMYAFLEYSWWFSDNTKPLLAELDVQPDFIVEKVLTK